MKIGYPRVDAAMGCRSGTIFRRASYSDERVATVVAARLACLRRVLERNVAHGLPFFRIGSSGGGPNWDDLDFVVTKLISGKPALVSI